MKNVLQKVLRFARNFYLDIKFGYKFLGGSIKSNTSVTGAKDTANTSYEILSFIFNELYKIKDSDVIVDIGCGKGRSINWWLNEHPKNKMIGIELNSIVASFTKNRLKKFKNVTIIDGNALENIPRDGTIFYLYNPFDDKILKEFKNVLFKSIKNKGKITIIYCNCAYIHEFSNDDRYKVLSITEIPNDKYKHNVAIIQFATS